MKNLRHFLLEAGGAERGRLEIANTPISVAIQYAEKLFERNGISLSESIPDFEDNYGIAQRKAEMGWTRRKDMPVISSRDVDDFEDKLNDGSLTDTRVRTRKERIPVGDLNPIQKQIYVDKSLGAVVENGVKESRRFFNTKTKFIVSSDNYILDGHHRFLSAVLLDPSLNVTILKIDLPIKRLLPVSVEYSDSIGNERNK